MEYNTDSAVDFFRREIWGLSAYFARKHGEVPPEQPMETTPFKDPHCIPDCDKMRRFMAGVRRMHVVDSSSIAALKQEVESASELAIIINKPSLYMPNAARVDLLIVCTPTSIFNIVLCYKNNLMARALDTLKSSVKGRILGHHPEGLCRYLAENFDWYPTITDIAPHVDRLQKWKSTLSDVYRVIVDASPC